MTVTREAVLQAADALQAAGITPSAPKIRQELGGGSYSTILRHLSEWRSSGSMALAPPVPEKVAVALQSAVHAMWSAISAETQSQIQSERDASAARASAIEQELCEALAEIQRLEVALKEEGALKLHAAAALAESEAQRLRAEGAVAALSDQLAEFRRRRRQQVAGLPRAKRTRGEKGLRNRSKPEGVSQ